MCLKARVLKILFFLSFFFFLYFGSTMNLCIMYSVLTNKIENAVIENEIDKINPTLSIVSLY